DFAAQAASTLQAVHDRDLFHGALTREDLFLVPDLTMPRGERVKLLDFGTGRLRRPGGDRDLPGTSVYLAPEQWEGTDPIDHRADIYALGGLLYHALTGVPPFLARTRAELRALHLGETPLRPRAINRDVPTRVEA